MRAIRFTLFILFCFFGCAFTVKAQQAATYILAAEKYEQAAKDCPQYKQCYLDNAGYLRLCANALRSGNGGTMPRGAPTCKMGDCAQGGSSSYNNTNSYNNSGSNKNVVEYDPFKYSQLTRDAAMEGYNIMQSDAPTGVKVTNVLGTAATTMATIGGASEEIVGGIGAGFSILSSIIGAFSGGQARKREAEMQRQAEEQRRAEAAQEAERKQRMIGAYNAQMQAMKEREAALEAERAAIAQREKERNYTAADWYNESNRADLNAAGKVQALTNALGKDPNYMAALEKRGLLYYKEANDNERAAADFARAMELKTNHAEIYYSAAEIGYKNGNYGYAVNFYEQAMAMNNGYRNADNLEKLAYSYYAIGNIEKSIAYYSEVVRLKPNDKRVLFQKAKIEFFAKKYQQALSNFTRLTTLDDNNKEYYYYKGFCEMNLLDYPHAIADLDIAVRIDYKYAEAYYIRGYAKYENHDYKGAKDDFTQSIWYSQDNPLFYYYRGSAEYNLGEYEKAAKDAEEAVNFNPTFKDAMRVFVQSQEKLNSDNAEFQNWFASYHNGEERLNNVYYQMATFYSVKGSKSTSLDWLQKAVKAGLNDYSFVRSDPMMNNVKTERRFGFILGD